MSNNTQWTRIAKREHMAIEQTGGNCTAYRLNFSDGSYCYICSSGGCEVPSDGDTVGVGIYPNDLEYRTVDSWGEFDNIHGTPNEQWDIINKHIKDYEQQHKVIRVSV